MRGPSRSALVLFWTVACSTCSKPDDGPPPRSSDWASASQRQDAESPSQPKGPVEFSERVEERQRLADSIEEEGVSDSRVLGAVRRVPRHAFVPADVVDMAYADRPLPIGNDQTISQPYIVAAMTEAVEAKPTSRCLEIGTGSGYQAAILAEICKVVYSIEYLPDVAAFGEKNLRHLGYGPDRVHLKVGDGYEGWPSAAPFDAIMVTAAPEKVPPPLLQQLKVRGKLVIPVGPEDDVQYLERWTRLREGDGPDAFDRDRLMGVRFVPFLGEAAKPE
jgi:protein-L-isoaspartate(D-aspartate) O-methyltransferase